MRLAAVRRPDSELPSEAAAGPSRAVLDVAECAAIFTRAGEAAYVWDAATDVLVWSENASGVLGISKPDRIATGKAFAALSDPQHPVAASDAGIGNATSATVGGVPYALRYCLQEPEAAELRWIEDAGRWFPGADGKPARAEGIVHDVTERHRREQELLQMTAVDSLTGGINRSRLCQIIEDELDQALRSGASFALLLIGIDDLGRVNRAYGFDLADQVIGMVAQRLCSRIRASDVFARFSGNKFGIILRDCNGNDLAVAAARFVNAVRETPLETAVGPIAVSVTSGGIVAPRHAHSVAEVLGRAQEALDLALAAGRGSFRAYVPSAESEARRRENMRLTDVIVSALNERRVNVAFQPVVNAKTREAAFRECLMRLHDADGSEIDAMEVLPVAEKLDLVRMIDHRVLELVANELRSDPSGRLSLNVSASSIHDPVWLAAFSAEMRNGLGSRLIVEITESTAIHDVEATRRFVERVQASGGKVAIDDFGAGYTSFRNLRRLGVDMVKIDGSFVANLEYAPDDRAFVRALLELARELGLSTVAEWVQSEAAAEMLIEWGCEYFQGALVGLAVKRPDVKTVVREEAARAG